MERVAYSNASEGFFSWQKFRDLRAQDKLIDLQLTTKEGRCVKAHRLILAASYPLLQNTMISGQDEMAFRWKRFPKDIVEAIVNYAYTGKITISTENATRLCLLAHNLGSNTIVSWCVEFLRTRISQDNVAAVWSLANVTMNRELMRLCTPRMPERFIGAHLPQELLLQTTLEQFDMLLEDKRLINLNEEAKFRTIAKWLKAAFVECDSENRERMFTRLISKVDLTRLSAKCLNEFLTFVRGCSELFRTGAALPTLGMKSKGKMIKQNLLAVPYYQPPSREVLLTVSRGATSTLCTVSSLPQLQPGESFNTSLPFRGEATVVDGRLCFVTCAGKESSLMLVNCRNGSIFYKPFYTSDREYYAVASTTESIFIFGGYFYEQCLDLCEKLDITNGDIMQLPHLPSARRDVSALNIPDVGIVVVGGLHQTSCGLTKSNNADLLVKDPKNANDWRWVELKPMLQARRSPGIAYFKGCAVVVGGDEELTAECLPLPSIAQTEVQWTRLHGCYKQYSTAISLATFNERLILLLSDYTGADVYEFLPLEADQSLANFEWKLLFRLDNAESPRLFLAIEELEEGQDIYTNKLANFQF